MQPTPSETMEQDWEPLHCAPVKTFISARSVKMMYANIKAKDSLEAKWKSCWARVAMRKLVLNIKAVWLDAAP